MMEPQTAEQMQNLIGVRGYVMTFWKGRAVLLDWCSGGHTGYSFRGLDRMRNPVDIHIPLADATKPLFVVTSKTRVNWPW
jgi:hypothetical protein